MFFYRSLYLEYVNDLFLLEKNYRKVLGDFFDDFFRGHI